VKYTQFLVFEIGRQCNLADHHQRCPSGTPDRYGELDTSRALTDDVIVAAARLAYNQMGFRGNIAWHYYNEPMLQWGRIRGLIGKIREVAKRAKFTLWTNGTLLIEETEGLDLLHQIWVTNYQRKELSWLQSIAPRVVIMDGYLDDRRLPLAEPITNRCLRPYSELIIDHYGNGHLCCMDWRGECRLGNVHTDGFAYVVERFQEAREQVARQPMAEDAPSVCSHCRGHANHIAPLVGSVQKLTIKDQPWIRQTQVSG